MTDTRARRLRSLAYLIRQGGIASQEEATERLAALGFAATQATVSRDLELLGAVKVKRAGVLAYALPDQIGGTDRDAARLERILREWVLSIEAAGPLIVIKTPPGSAHLVASAIDHAELAEIAGTVSGDDTMFLAVRDGHAIPAVLRKFAALIGQTKEEFA